MVKQIKIILLADDDLEDQEILQDIILQLEPVTNVQTVKNGQQVLEWLQRCPDAELPCLIILDYKMPILNAAEVLDKVLTQERYHGIPVVVWSSSKQPEHVQKCLDKGAANYFVKPNRMNDLRDMAQKMLLLTR